MKILLILILILFQLEILNSQYRCGNIECVNGKIKKKNKKKGATCNQTTSECICPIPDFHQRK
jgi:hypothetical protein